MEEKTVCPECENKEHKLETLTEEEAGKIAGGCGPECGDAWKCPQCGRDNFSRRFCKDCGFENVYST